MNKIKLLFRCPEFHPYAAIVGDTIIAFTAGAENEKVARDQLEAWMTSPGYKNHQDLYQAWARTGKRVMLYE